MPEGMTCTSVYALVDEVRQGRIVKIAFAPVGDDCRPLGGRAFLCRRTWPDSRKNRWFVIDTRDRPFGPRKFPCSKAEKAEKGWK